MSVKEKAMTKLAALNENIASLFAAQQSIEFEISESRLQVSKIEQFLEVYENLSTEETPIGAVVRGVTSNYSNQEVPQYNSPVIFLKTHEIIDLTYDFLESHAPKSSDQIVGYLEHSGRGIKGTDKLTYVAAILSKSDKFVSRRKYGGWFLAEKDPESNKDESPTIGVVGDSIL